MFYSPLLSIFKLILTGLIAILCATFQMIFFCFPKKFFFIFPRFFFKILVFIFGIKTKTFGVMENQNVLYVCNHSSYLDILILGSKIDGLFVAKSEVSGWPIINKLAKLGGTIFINRTRKFDTKNQISSISSSLRKGYNVILFPEGTSNDGNKVLPFKSSLFAVAEEEFNQNFCIQPISLTYTGLDGLPLSRMFKPFFAWYGNMELFSHAWKFLGIDNCEIKLSFHKSLSPKQFKSRKQISDYCQKVIQEQVSYDLNNKCGDKIQKLYNLEYL